jgi:hypothetical protein
LHMEVPTTSKICTGQVVVYIQYVFRCIFRENMGNK